MGNSANVGQAAITSRSSRVQTESDRAKQLVGMCSRRFRGFEGVFVLDLCAHCNRLTSAPVPRGPNAIDAVQRQRWIEDSTGECVCPSQESIVQIPFVQI